jgi:hypothetical protein
MLPNYSTLGGHAAGNHHLVPNVNMAILATPHSEREPFECPGSESSLQPSNSEIIRGLSLLAKRDVETVVTQTMFPTS